MSCNGQKKKTKASRELKSGGMICVYAEAELSLKTAAEKVIKKQKLNFENKEDLLDLLNRQIIKLCIMPES